MSEVFCNIVFCKFNKGGFATLFSASSIKVDVAQHPVL